MKFERPSLDTLVRISRVFIVVLTAAILLKSWVAIPLDSSIPNNDQAQNLKFAYHLANSFTFSKDSREKKEQRVSSWREPLPPLVLSGYMKIIEPFIGDVSLKDYSKAKYAEILKYHNFFWGFLLAVAAFVSIVLLCNSYIAAAIMTVWVNNYLVWGFDDLGTKLQGASLLILSSLLLSLAVKDGRRGYFIAAGLSFAALALTKAAFLYIVIVIVLVLAAYWLWCRRYAPARLPTRNFGWGITAFAISFALLVSPWLIRNYVHFGKIQLTERSGFILLARAMYNEMSWEEYRGAVWFWSRGERLSAYLGQELGFSGGDLEGGGRLQKLNRSNFSSFKEADKRAEREGRPEDVVSYFRASRAWYKKFKRDAKERGELYPENIGQSKAKSLATKMILANPLKHLAMTPLFLWRSGIYAFLILTTVVGICFYFRKDNIAFFAIPSLLSVMLYATVSHNRPRYSIPMELVAGICVAILVVMLLRWLVARSEIDLPWLGQRR